MNEGTIITVILQAALTAGLGYFFNYRLGQSEKIWREESERRLHADKWLHDEQRTIEQNLMSLVIQISDAMSDMEKFVVQKNYLPTPVKRDAIQAAWDKWLNLQTFMRMNQCYMNQELVEAITTFDTAVWLGIFSAGSEFRNPDEKLVEEIESQLIEDGLIVKRLTKDEKKLAARKRVTEYVERAYKGEDEISRIAAIKV